MDVAPHNSQKLPLMDVKLASLRLLRHGTGMSMAPVVTELMNAGLDMWRRVCWDNELIGLANCEGHVSFGLGPSATLDTSARTL